MNSLEIIAVCSVMTIINSLAFYWTGVNFNQIKMSIIAGWIFGFALIAFNTVLGMLMW